MTYVRARRHNARTLEALSNRLLQNLQSGAQQRFFDHQRRGDSKNVSVESDRGDEQEPPLARFKDELLCQISGRLAGSFIPNDLQAPDESASAYVAEYWRFRLDLRQACGHRSAELHRPFREPI